MSKDAGLAVIEDASLSRAWARTLLHIVDNPGTSISPLVVCITDFTNTGEPQEDVSVRTALDTCLANKHRMSIKKVAWTIFPKSTWNFAKRDRQRLYDLYMKSFPRIQSSATKICGGVGGGGSERSDRT